MGGRSAAGSLPSREDHLNGAVSGLSKISKLEIESKSVIPRESVRGAITLPVDEFLGTLTKKQLAAFMAAMQMGYYGMPKGTTIDEIFSKQGMKRSTHEEHLEG